MPALRRVATRTGRRAHLWDGDDWHDGPITLCGQMGTDMLPHDGSDMRTCSFCYRIWADKDAVEGFERAYPDREEE